MLSENKVESLSALAEISILISDSKIVEYYQISDEVNPFLSSILFLLKDLNNESVSLVSKFIDTINKNGVDAIDYKTKYEKALEEIHSLHKELILLKQELV